jgi:cytochrome c biogenesis protein CcmG/thiol:disulfide interchange protein DsbE
MTIKKHLISYTFISLLLGFSFQGCSQEEASKKQTAPDFTLQDLSGMEVSLRQHKGQVVLLDFWATWCGPCRMSIPELVRLQEKYQDQGLVVLGVSADDPRKTSNQTLMAFKDQFKINYSILRADAFVKRAYFGNGQMPLPTLFVIDREGVVVDSIVGYMPGAVESSLKKLI